MSRSAIPACVVLFLVAAASLFSVPAAAEDSPVAADAQLGAARRDGVRGRGRDRRRSSTRAAIQPASTAS